MKIGASIPTRTELIGHAHHKWDIPQREKAEKFNARFICLLPCKRLTKEVVGQGDLADLYSKLWRVELHLREIKSTMELDILRAKTLEMVRQEL